MPIDMLSSFAALILAISLASERLVSMLKTLVGWLDTPQQQASSEKSRRVIVLAIAFATAWTTAAFLTTTSGWHPFGVVQVNQARSLPAWLVAFLASGGSAFWNNVLGYTKAVKDIKKDQVPDAKRGPN